MPRKKAPCPTCGQPTRADRCWSCFRAVDEVDERFDAKVDTSGGLFGCWPWTGARLRSGYGAFKAPTGFVIASRYALERALGRPLGPGMQACHTCDNPPCVSPVHLFEGSPIDNARDMVAKGRSAAAIHPESIVRGESVSQARLTTELVLALRRRRAEGASYPRLAGEFGIAISHAQRVAKGESWAHIPMEVSRA